MRAANLLFGIGLALCLVTLVGLPESAVAFVPPGALLFGATLALTLGCPYPEFAKKANKLLLQGAVVLLGFSLDIHQVLDAGSRGILFALASISAVFGLGWLLMRWLKVRPSTSLLVSAGTAICGGSAIAAVASVTDADQEDVSVAVGTVFILNAIALVVFPPIGRALGLSPEQFGTWAGIAIHDVSSVVGAATAYGGAALTTATAVKLSRVLYLVPIVLGIAYARRSKKGGASAPVPWFIGLFLLASLARSYVPSIAAQAPTIKLLAVCGFSAALFLIGTGISRKTLRAVGTRPLIQGVILWAFMTVAALATVRSLG